MRPQYLTPSEEFHLNGFVCEETLRHLLDYQITSEVVELIQEQLEEIVNRLPKRRTKQAQEIKECVGKVEALLSNYQETLE